MARLQWLDRDGQILALTGRPVLVGTDASCILRPKRVRCGRRHARIAFVDERYVVEAVSPEHVVLVNGEAISARILEDRDEIVCDDLRITFWRD